MELIYRTGDETSYEFGGGQTLAVGETGKSPDASGETALTEAFPKIEELKSAQAYFSEVKYGATTNYFRPFSRQLKDEISSAFPIDHKYYQLANRAQANVCGQYLFLRILTIFFYFIVVGLQIMGFASGQSSEIDGKQFSGFIQSVLDSIALSANANLFAYVGVISIVGIMARLAARFVLFDWIMERSAERLSHDIFKKISVISDEVREACSKARDRTGSGGPWPKRANAWITIALWNAKRAEYLDRFSTTVIWCVQTYTKNVEIWTFWLKVAITASAMLAVQFDPWPSLFLAAQLLLLWHWLGQKPRNFWTLAFRKSADDIEEDADNYPSKIGGVVENLVDEVLGGEFGSAGRTTGKRS